MRRSENKGNQGRDGSGGLPNLAALPAHSFAIEHNPGDGHDYLNFGATIYNGGPGPLVVEGFRGGDAPTMTAVQYIYRNGKPVQSATIGAMEFDRRPVNLLAAGANWQPDRLGLFSACASEESIWLRQVLPAGWGATYIQNLAGQSFDITAVADQYQVRVTANPFRRITETTFAHNTSLAVVTIGGAPGQRSVIAGWLDDESPGSQSVSAKWPDAAADA